MRSYKIHIYALYAPAFLGFLCKYWSDDGLLRPKLLANSNITINIIQLCQTEYLYNLFLLVCCKNKGWSSIKIDYMFGSELFIEITTAF